MPQPCRPQTRFRATKVKVLIFFVNNLLKFTDEDKLMNKLIETESLESLEK